MKVRNFISTTTNVTGDNPFNPDHLAVYFFLATKKFY